jgi:tight adherence protein C
MMDLIPDPQTIILGLATAATFFMIAAMALPFLERDPLTSRLAAVAKRREELSHMQRSKTQKRQLIGQRQVGTMKVILEGLKLQNLLGSKALRVKLLQGGLRGQAPIVVFVFARLLLPVVFAVLAVLVLFVGKKFELELGVKVAIMVGAAFAGLGLPGLLLRNMIQRRQKLMTLGFPDALDLLVICVESGLSVEAAFNRVTEEMALSAPIVAEEFGLTSAELAFFTDRRMALDNLVDRTGLPAVKSLVTALAQSEKYGTSLATSLRVLAQESRDSRMMRAEEKAASLPAKLTVPMITFFLPVIFLVVLGPAVIQVRDTF